MMNTTEMANVCNARADEILAKIDGKKKNPDFYKNQREARTLLIMKTILSDLAEYTETSPLTGDLETWFSEITTGIKRTSIEVNEGDDFFDLAKKYINKTTEQLMKAISDAGLHLEGTKVVR